MSQHATVPKPTARQLSYLKALARQTGTSFTYPQSRRAASDEIERLTALKRRSGRPLPERSTGREADAVYATAVQDDEVTGYGVNAHWRGAHTEPEELPKPGQPKVGQRSELARYQAGTEQRVLHRQRVGDAIRITDSPASGAGRAYIVERELAHDEDAAIDGIVSDYLAQAQTLGRVPMAPLAQL